MLKIGVIGYGYWGPNLVRNFFEHDTCVIKKVADKRVERLAILQKIYPSILVTTSDDEIINDPNIDAIIIATPVHTHFSLAKKALLKGKHVLLEKPMTTSFKEAQILADLAKKKKLILMVDHTFVYTDAVAKIKSILDRGEIGKIKYFDSTRINLGLFQEKINVLWDLASHDISILSYLIDEKPLTIAATGVSHTGNKIENIGFLIIKYKSGLIAHFNCSWSSPVKIRMILIGGDRKMIVYNDVEPSEKVRVYDAGYNLKKNKDKSKILVDYRAGDIYLPKIELKEALSNLAADFISAVLKKTEPKSGWKMGLKVVKILELAEKSMKSGGREIKYEKH